ESASDCFQRHSRSSVLPGASTDAPVKSGRPGRHAWYVYVPGGTEEIVNRPSRSETAKYGESTTFTYAIMFGWMLQKMRLSPGVSNRTWRLVPTGYRPRSNRLPSWNEKTLWKTRSLLGKSTIVPARTASTRGKNAALR